MKYKNVLIQALANVSGRPEEEGAGIFRLMCRESPEIEGKFDEEVDAAEAKQLLALLTDTDTARAWMMGRAFPPN